MDDHTDAAGLAALFGTTREIVVDGTLSADGLQMAARKIKLRDTLAMRLAGWAGTMAWVSLGAAFTAGYHKLPVIDSFRLIAAAFGVS